MVVEIRAEARIMSKIRRASVLGPDVKLTEDNSVKEAVVMLAEEGKLIPGIVGNKVVTDFAKHGYVRVLKRCPFRHRKCIAEKCQLYVIKDGIGGCSFSWNFIPLGR